jgi:hypothetical protein
MARPKGKTVGPKTAKTNATQPPYENAQLQQAFGSLPCETQSILMGILVNNPGVLTELLKTPPEGDDSLANFQAWIERMAKALHSAKEYEPVSPKYTGKAMAVRAKVDSQNKDNISKPDIFGVFASKEASGVLADDDDPSVTESDYKCAVSCAKGTGRSRRSARASDGLTKPLKALEDRGIVERSGAQNRGFKFCPGCEQIFEDSRILWPPPKKRSEYVEPAPRKL